MSNISMKDTLVYTIVLITVFVNFVLTLYMAWKSFDMMIYKCKCATSNIYWYGIFAYLLLSFVLVVYSFLSSIGYIHPKVYQQFLVVYIVATVVFVYASVRYTKIMKTISCDCLDAKYKSFLSFMILIRYLGVLAVAIGLVAYGFYLFFYNK